MLSDKQAALVAGEQAVLARLGRTLDDFGAEQHDKSVVAEVTAGLTEMFLLVIVGEFNSGKSSIINALIGQKVLTEGVTPTTAQITVLRYGQEPETRGRGSDMLEVFHPAPFLREIAIVDTPGTNAVIEGHQTLTETFVPRSDLVLFVTSAERPFTESERAFLTKVKGWGKKIVVVLNKVDLLGGQVDLDQVMDFVRDRFRALLGIDPPIFAVSGRMAYQAKTMPDGWGRQQALNASGFGIFERFVFETLDEESRVRLKLAAPLGVAASIIERYGTNIRREAQLLAQDRQTIDRIDRQLALYGSDMRQEFDARMAKIDTVLYGLRDKGEAFLDEYLRFSHLPDLVRGEKFRQAFETQVVGDEPQRIEDGVQGLIAWLVERDVRIWQDVTTYLNERRAAAPQHELLGKADSSAFEAFTTNRQRLLRDIGQQARAIVESYDQRAEALALSNAMKDTLAQATIANVAGLGLGATVVALAGTALVDVTGIFFALVMGGIGFYLIPARRRKSKTEFRARIEMLTRTAAHQSTRSVRDRDRPVPRAGTDGYRALHPICACRERPAG